MPVSFGVDAGLTRVLEGIGRGEPRAAEELLPLVYDELRRLAEARLARERAGISLQPTALVHEAYLRLLGPQGAGGADWNGSRHFFGAAAEAMRRILIDRARARNAEKRGGGAKAASDTWLLELPLSGGEEPADLLDLDDAITALSAESPSHAALVRLRFYGGLTLEQAGRALGLSPGTADRHWAFARAWLYQRLSK